jgi:hypothetical protein
MGYYRVKYDIGTAVSVDIHAGQDNDKNDIIGSVILLPGARLPDNTIQRILDGIDDGDAHLSKLLEYVGDSSDGGRTAKELKEAAKELGIEGYSNMKKAELEKAVAEAESALTPSAPADPNVVVSPVETQTTTVTEPVGTNPFAA